MRLRLFETGLGIATTAFEGCVVGVETIAMVFAVLAVLSGVFAGFADASQGSLFQEPNKTRIVGICTLLSLGFSIGAGCQLGLWTGVGIFIIVFFSGALGQNIAIWLRRGV